MVLPPFNLAATVNGREVSPALFKGKRGVIVVHGAKTADAAKEVAKAVRGKFPSADDVVLVSIVDLRAFAGMWKKVAEAQLKSTYTKLAAKATEAGMDPVEHVLICPDWDGTVGQALGVPDPDSVAAVLVVGTDGELVARLTGQDLATGVLAALA